jgi:hypothetical protein
MERGARVVIRDAVLTTLLALLLVLSISMGDEAQFPAAAATSPAAGADHPTADVGPGPSSALAVPASSSQRSHRVDSPSPALPGVLVGTACSSASTAGPAASDGLPHSVTHVTPDGRAPPA